MGAIDSRHKRLAVRIHAELTRKGHRVNELMGVLNLSKNSVYRRNEGDIPYRAVEVFKIAAWLNVPVAKFDDSDDEDDS